MIIVTNFPLAPHGLGNDASFSHSSHLGGNCPFPGKETVQLSDFHASNHTLAPLGNLIGLEEAGGRLSLENILGTHGKIGLSFTGLLALFSFRVYQISPEHCPAGSVSLQLNFSCDSFLRTWTGSRFWVPAWPVTSCVLLSESLNSVVPSLYKRSESSLPPTCSVDLKWEIKQCKSTLKTLETCAEVNNTIVKYHLSHLLMLSTGQRSWTPIAYDLM